MLMSYILNMDLKGDSRYMNSNLLSPLDRAWQSNGMTRLKQMFGSIARRNPQEALRLVNDDRLRFPVLFSLIDEIMTYRLYEGLNEKNKVALGVCADKINKLLLDSLSPTEQDDTTMRQTLLWMFETGRNWGGPSAGRDDYDAVIDYIAAMLIELYEDRSIMKDIAALIFRRNREGLFIHDLVWSFFQTLDGDALAAVAEYLTSGNPRDQLLAKLLLGMEERDTPDREELQRTKKRYIDWVNENRPYLYLTGEHFQMTSKPHHFGADKEAKYLGKPISARHRAPFEPLSDQESTHLHQYREATSEEQTLLTDYSHKLRLRDRGQWERWMEKETAEQVVAAKMTYEAI